MTTKHAPSGRFLLWCDHCGHHAYPDTDRERQDEHARRGGWHAGCTGDLCPRCRPLLLKTVDELLARSDAE